MTSDASNLPEHVPGAPVEARAEPPSGDPFATELRGFGQPGILAILLIVAGQIVAPLSAVLVLAWAWRSHTPWSEIGYVRPNSWIRTVAVGIVFGSAFKFVMKAIVMPLLGADPRHHWHAARAQPSHILASAKPTVNTTISGCNPTLRSR